MQNILDFCACRKQVKAVQIGKYEDYNDTIRFYISLGFKEFEELLTLWDEANPCQIYVMSFMDMDPINEGHILLVPTQHYSNVDEIPDELLAHLLIVSKKIVKALKEIYNPNGYSIMQNGGEFNDVGHYHLHIFPRYVGDGFGWTYGSEEKTVNSEIAERIRKQILKLELKD